MTTQIEVKNPETSHGTIVLQMVYVNGAGDVVGHVSVPAIVKPGETAQRYVYQGCAFLITEKPE